MENLITFNTTELLLFLTMLPVLIFALIIAKKYLIKKIKRNFDFNTGHYLIGLAISLSTSLALINWETYDHPLSYHVEDDMEETNIVHTPRTFQREIVKAVPPPPKQKKLIKSIDLTKLKLVKDELPVEKNLPETPVVDSPDAPAKIIAAIPPPMPEPIIESDEPDFVFIADQMPRFPGCEDSEEDMLAKEVCSKMELMRYIYKNLRYPALARGNNIQGLVVLQFVVSKEGRIEDLRIVRDIGGGCGSAAAKVVSAMNEMEEPWMAGKQRGRPVKVMYTLPVKFKLN